MRPALPALVAFALFPGWSKSLEVLAAFVIIDLFAAQIVEPFIIGSGIDVSPIVLLTSAMYWSMAVGPARITVGDLPNRLFESSW